MALNEDPSNEVGGMHQRCDDDDFFGVDPMGCMSLWITLDMPPSDNKIYWNHPAGGRVLRSEAKRFKREVKNRVAKLVATSRTNSDFVVDVPYRIVLGLYFEATENSTFGQKGGAKTRYKHMDASNRRKLIIDAVMESIGIDDCHIFEERVFKRVDAENPRVVVVVSEIEPRYGGQDGT